VGEVLCGKNPSPGNGLSPAKGVPIILSGAGCSRFGRKLTVLPHQKEPHMTADQMNKRVSEQSVVWDQYFCAALIAESHLTAPVVGEATHEDRQNLLIQRAKALADKMLENRR
jgi:hypothetical protein